MKAPALAKNTIPELLLQAGAGYADRPSLAALDVPGGRMCTYGELLDDVRLLAKGLAARGLEPGQRVALLGGNSPEWARAYLAVSMSGAVNVPVDSLLSENEIKQLLAGADIRMIFADLKFMDILLDSSAGFSASDNIISLAWEPRPVDNKSGRDIPGLNDIRESGRNAVDIVLPDVESSHLAAIIFTSGTTGSPKGVMLTHSNIVSDVIACERAIAGYLTIGEERFLSVLPMNHTFECTAGFLLPLYTGCRITYARSLRSRYLMEDIKSSETTMMFGVPLLFKNMVEGILRAVDRAPLVRRQAFKAMMKMVKMAEKVGNADLGIRLFRSIREKAGLGSLKFFISGGAPLPLFVAVELNRLGIMILQGYGLTEASPVLTINPPDAPRNASIGKPLPGVQVKVLDPDSQGIGDLGFKGPMIMKGYYNDPDATDAVLQNGWLATGDLGHIDDDGYVYVCGRSKNLIVTAAGKNVYPEEIETELNRRPFILESMVYGRERQGRSGEDTCAVIVPDFEVISERCIDKVLSGQQVEELVAANVKEANAMIAPYKRVKSFKIINEELPKTSTKKIKRYLINAP